MVDSSGHIDYYIVNKKYADTIRKCIKTWEKYKSGIFRETNNQSGADLIIANAFSLGATWDGFTNYNSKTIYLNVAYYDSEDYQNNKKYIQHSITHELGHALGLDENNDGLTTDVMRQGRLKNIKLTIDDKASFDEAAKRY